MTKPKYRKEFNTKFRMRCERVEKDHWEIYFEILKKNGSWYKIDTNRQYYSFISKYYAKACMEGIYEDIWRITNEK